MTVLQSEQSTLVIARGVGGYKNWRGGTWKKGHFFKDCTNYNLLQRSKFMLFRKIMNVNTVNSALWLILIGNSNLNTENRSTYLI